MKVSTLLFLMIVLSTNLLFSRNFRVNQVPNGSKYSCNTCHTGFGGPRNDFGKQIETSYLDVSGNVLWGSALALLDSDNDGKSNGEELQDPNGNWKTGDPAPGTLSLVSNPGDPNSTTDIEDHLVLLPRTLQLYPNYPNPFNPTTTLTFSVPEPSVLRLVILNSVGQQVREFEHHISAPGTYSQIWNGLDETGVSVMSGIYFARLESGKVSQTIRMLMLK